MGKKRIKWDIKKVKKYFKDHDCELLETEYKNIHTPMRYRCKCKNNKCKIRFSSFKIGKRCMECSGSKKHTLEEVKKYFEDNNCKLLETEYVNSKTKMKYICECKNHSEITFNNFKKGKRCRKCSGCEKYTYKFVYNYFKDHNCKLLETEYIGTDTPMEYECSCGNNECKITFYHFKTGQRCKKCGGKEKLTFEFIKQYFEDHNCKLLETEYENVGTKMRYECSCGNSDCKISFNKFKSGQRCKICAIKKRSGKNHWNYKPDLTDEERNNKRNSPEDTKWRKDILKQDNDTCQCCFQEGGKLIAHHIESYGDNKELRTITSNGITLCEEHHIEFHKKYGYGNNNRKQLEEFLISSIIYS